MQNSRLSRLALAAFLAAGAGGARAADEAGAAEEWGPGARLEQQVRVLASALAAARGEADAWRARAEGRWVAAGGTAAALPAEGVRLREVNRALDLVVTDAGAKAGLRVGMALMVMRGKQALARVRVVDVRRRLAGAVVEELLPGAPYPGPGDRLVVMTDGE